MTIKDLIQMTKESHAGSCEITLSEDSTKPTPTAYVLCVVGVREIEEIKAAVLAVTDKWAQSEKIKVPWTDDQTGGKNAGKSE